MDADTRAVFREFEPLLKDIARATRAITKHHAQELESQLRDLPPKPTCQRLIAEVKRTLKKGYRAHDRDQDRLQAELDAAIKEALDS